MNQEFLGRRSSSLGCLREAALFSSLSAAEIVHFQNAAQTRTFRKGKVLFLEGEQAEFFYVVCTGWIKLFHTMPEGDEVIIDMLTRGHLAGENAVFEKDRHTSSAEVIEDVRLLSIPLRVLKDQIGDSQTLALSMLSAMSRYHRRHYGEMALNATQTAPQRIGCFLLKFCPRGKEKDIAFHLPYDKTLIADTLGMKGATFSRALNMLRLKTGLRIKGSRVEIDSVERLIQFVYGPLAVKYAREEIWDEAPAPIQMRPLTSTGPDLQGVG